MVAYNIIVRSYKRSHQIVTHTLAMLARQEGNLLTKTIVLVADESEYNDYYAAFKEHNLFPREMIVTEKGGAQSNNKFFREMAIPGEYLFMIDDDVKALYEYTDINDQKSKREILTLDSLLQYGFALLDKYDLGAFSFDYGNPYFKQDQPFAKVGMYRVTGTFYGARYCPELMSDFSHEDDNIRSAQLLEKYSRNAIFNWMDVKLAPMGKNPGGLQADGSRDNTLAVCEEVIKRPEIVKYFKEELVFNDKYNVYTLKYRHKNELKKLANYKPEVKIMDFYGAMPDEATEEKVDLFTFG